MGFALSTLLIPLYAKAVDGDYVEEGRTATAVDVITIDMQGDSNLNGVDNIDAITESTIESAIDALPNLSTINSEAVNPANWNTAYGWGDHSSQNYFDKDTDDLFDISGFPADPDADECLMWDDDPGEFIFTACGGGGGDVDSSDFTVDGGVLVGTGVGTYQEESGATLRTSLGLGDSDDVTHHSLTLSDTTLDTADSFRGIDVSITKTAGATDSDDLLRAGHFTASLNQSAGELGVLYGLYSSADLVDGTVLYYVVGGRSGAAIRADGNVEDTYGFGHVFGSISSAILESGATVDGNVFGAAVVTNMDADPGGTAYGIHLTENGSYLDYGFYQAGSSPNYFGGKITSNTGLNIPTGTPSSASDTCITGDIEWDSSYIYICIATDTWKRAAISTWP